MDQASEAGTNVEDSGPSTLQLPRKVLKKEPPGILSVDMRKHSTVKKKYPERQYCECSVHEKKGLTSYTCKFCDIPLYRGECFTKYYTVPNQSIHVQ